MKTNQVVLQLQTVSPELNNGSTKLVSLLALAASAIAMPQTGSADIIYTDLGGSPATVGYGSGSADYQVLLPGTAHFKFVRQAGSGNTSVGSLTTNYRFVRAGDFFTNPSNATVKLHVLASPNGFAAPLNFGQPWNQGLGLSYFATMGIRDDLGRRTPSSDYDHKYLAFQFGNSDQGGATRYGWIEVGLAINVWPSGPLVTIYRYGWDNTGAQPTMGQVPVPEPSSAAIVALGAMALGARGVRSWRQKRDAASV